MFKEGEVTYFNHNIDHFNIAAEKMFNMCEKLFLR